MKLEKLVLSLLVIILIHSQSIDRNSIRYFRLMTMNRKSTISTNLLELLQNDKAETRITLYKSNSTF